LALVLHTHLYAFWGNVDEYFREYDELRSRVTQLGVQMSDDVFIAIRLNGLPPEYNILRTAFLTKDDVTVAQLHEALRSEQSWSGGSSERQKEDVSQVLAASGGSSSSRKPGQKFGNPVKLLEKLQRSGAFPSTFMRVKSAGS